jgi:hypothetical protein
MSARSILRSSFRSVAAGVGLAAGAYVTYVSATWCRYGHVPRQRPDEYDGLLDRFMPVYEVVERHGVQVAAPASVTLASARNVDLADSPVVRGVFKGRELIFRSAPRNRPQPRGLLWEVQSMGWVILAEIPGQEIVIGAVTKPWEPNVTFRSVPPQEFAKFNEPDYVKIVWTLRVDPSSETSSILRTETRAIATDRSARAKFRLYWSFLSPGIFLIRRMMLGSVKTEVEERVRCRDLA